MQRVLEEFDGNVTHTAKALGMDRRSLQRKLGKVPNLK
jgi:two-component system response regulator RegA